MVLWGGNLNYFSQWPITFLKHWISFEIGTFWKKNLELCNFEMTPDVSNPHLHISFRNLAAKLSDMVLSRIFHDGVSLMRAQGNGLLIIFYFIILFFWQAMVLRMFSGSKIWMYYIWNPPLNIKRNMDQVVSLQVRNLLAETFDKRKGVSYFKTKLLMHVKLCFLRSTAK